MSSASLGRSFEDGEIVARQGDAAECLYVVLEGEVEVVRTANGHEVRLGTAGGHAVLGETAFFLRRPRSATIRARGRARILTIDRRHVLGRLTEDPSIALRMIEMMADRVRTLDDRVVALMAEMRSLDRPPGAIGEAPSAG